MLTILVFIGSRFVIKNRFESNLVMFFG